MGLENNGAVLQRPAAVTLVGLSGNVCRVYLGDTIILSDSFGSHVSLIGRILMALKEAGFELKPVKCQFLKGEVKYLGHIISDGVGHDPDKIRCVEQFPGSKTVNEARHVLGPMGCCRIHIADFAKEI